MSYETPIYNGQAVNTQGTTQALDEILQKLSALNKRLERQPLPSPARPPKPVAYAEDNKSGKKQNKEKNKAKTSKPAIKSSPKKGKDSLFPKSPKGSSKPYSFTSDQCDFLISQITQVEIFLAQNFENGYKGRLDNEKLLSDVKMALKGFAIPK